METITYLSPEHYSIVSGSKGLPSRYPGTLLNFKFSTKGLPRTDPYGRVFVIPLNTLRSLRPSQVRTSLSRTRTLSCSALRSALLSPKCDRNLQEVNEGILVLCVPWIVKFRLRGRKVHWRSRILYIGSDSCTIQIPGHKRAVVLSPQDLGLLR